MSLYQCEKCGCVENTAFGWYHCRNMKDLTPPEDLGKALCSECGPTHYANGEANRKCGKWHGKFEKTIYPLGSLETDAGGNIVDKITKKHPSEKA